MTTAYRVTPSVLKSTFLTVVSSAKSAGVPDVDRWVLRPGSQTYGDMWLIVSRDPEAGETTLVYLGTTRSEAYMALAAMGAAFRMTI